VDGARISDVQIERIQVDDADTPIFLRLGARGRTFRTGDQARPAGSLSAIAIRDVTVRQARRIGILISGVPGHIIEEVTLERIDITMLQPPPPAGVSAAIPTAPTTTDPDEKPSTYPEVRMFGDTLPAYGIYARHVARISLIDVHIVGVPGDSRPERIVRPEAAT
jgi:hypothetical protein